MDGRVAIGLAESQSALGASLLSDAAKSLIEKRVTREVNHDGMDDYSTVS